jgi:hypothetical protein
MDALTPMVEESSLQHLYLDLLRQPKESLV